MKYLIINFNKPISVIILLSLLITTVRVKVPGESFLAPPGGRELNQSNVEKNLEPQITTFDDLRTLVKDGLIVFKPHLWQTGLPTPIKVQKILKRTQKKTHREALPLLLMARTSHRRTFPYESLVVLSNIASRYLYLGNYAEALKYTAIAIKNAQKLIDDFTYVEYRSSLIYSQTIVYGIQSKIYLAWGKPEESLSAAKKITQRIPGDPVGWGHTSSAFLALNKLQEALDAAEQYIQLAPKELSGYEYKCSALFAMGRFEEAQESAEIHTQLAPLNPVGWRFLCSVLLAKGKNIEALTAAEKGISINPSDHVSKGYKCEVFLALGNPEAALKLAEEIIELAPEDSGGWWYKSNALLSMGVKTFITKGRKAAEVFSRAQLDDLSADKDKYTSVLIRWLTHMGSPSKEEIFPPERVAGPTIEHVRFKHTLMSERYSQSLIFKTLFPEPFSRQSKLQELMEKVLKSLSSRPSIRVLPNGKKIEWWEKDVFVAYVPIGDSKELVRVIVIGNTDGEIVTVYPTFGPGVTSWRGATPLPSEVQFVIPWGSLIWNKSSGDPINMRVGNNNQGFMAMIKSPWLSKLDPVEREQLIWLAAVKGRKCYQDENFHYYRYKIPRNSAECKWREILDSRYVYLKVQRDSLNAVKILKSRKVDPEREDAANGFQEVDSRASRVIRVSK